MAAPFVVSTGNATSNVAAGQMGLPSGGVAGDIYIAFLETANEEFQQAALPAGWTLGPTVGVGTAASTTATRLTLIYHVRGSSSPATPTWPDVGDHWLGRMILVRGADTANPFEALTTQTVATSTPAGAGAGGAPAITTLGPQRLILFASSIPNDTSSNPFDAVTAPEGATTLNGSASATGNGGAWGLTYLEAIDAGTYGPAVFTIGSTSATQARLSVAVRPAAITNVYRHTTSGGLAVGGEMGGQKIAAAPPAEPVTRTHTTSGGLATGGTLGGSRTRSVAVSGQVITLGGSLVTRTRTATISGDVRISGTVTVARTRSRAISGQVVTLGGSLLNRTRTFTMSGPTPVMGGTMGAARTRAHDLSGGFVTAGGSLTSRTLSEIISGGVTIGGELDAALLANPPATIYEATLSGGLIIGGTLGAQKGHKESPFWRVAPEYPNPSRTFAHQMTGGAVIGGGLDALLIRPKRWEWVTSGGLEIGVGHSMPMLFRPSPFAQDEFDLMDIG